MFLLVIFIAIIIIALIKSFKIETNRDSYNGLLLLLATLVVSIWMVNKNMLNVSKLQEVSHNVCFEKSGNLASPTRGTHDPILDK